MNDQVIIELVEDALTELSDADEQRRLWLASQGPEVSSFEESVERLWDDSGLSIELNRRSVFGPALDMRFRALDRTLQRVNAHQPVEQLLNDPQLGLARKQASDLLRDLRRLRTDATWRDRGDQ